MKRLLVFVASALALTVATPSTAQGNAAPSRAESSSSSPVAAALPSSVDICNFTRPYGTGYVYVARGTEYADGLIEIECHVAYSSSECYEYLVFNEGSHWWRSSVWRIWCYT